MADAHRVTVGGIEFLRALDESVELALQRTEVANGAVDLCRAMAQQLEDVAAWGLAGVAEGDDAADLAE